MLEKTSPGKIAAAAGGLLLIISLFLKWSGVDLGDAADAISGAASQLGGSVPGAMQDQLSSTQKSIEDAASANAFDMFGWLPILYIVIGLLAIAPLVLDVLDLEVELPFDSSLVTLVGGLLVLGGMLMMLDMPGGMKFGAWLAVLAALAITVGGVLQVVGEEDAGQGGAIAYAPPPAAPAQPQYAQPQAPQPPAAPAATPPAQPSVPPQAPPQPPPGA